MNFLTTLPVSLQTIRRLLASNVFMTFAWYGHLRNMASFGRPCTGSQRFISFSEVPESFCTLAP